MCFPENAGVNSYYVKLFEQLFKIEPITISTDKY